MAFFDDDEDEKEQAGPLAVARAMSSDESGAAPDEMPDTTAKTQTVKGDPATSVARGLGDDGGAQVLSDYSYEEPDELKAIDSSSTDASQGPTAQASSPEEESDQGTASLASNQTYKAPVAPTLKPYSSANIEAAEQLANSKADFAGKIAAGAYKPSIWRKLGGAVSGGLVGFGTHDSTRGLEVANTITQDPLNRAWEAESAKESGIKSQIDAATLGNQRTQQENAQALQEYNLNERDFRNQAYADRQNALGQQERANAQAKLSEPVGFTPSDPTNPYAGGTVTTRSGKQVPNSAPPKGWIQEWSKSPAGQAATARMTVQTRKQLASDIGLRPGSEDYNEFLTNGKIARAARTSIHVPSAEQSKYSDWKTAFHKENGRDPNAAEIASYGHQAGGSMSKALGDRIESQKNTKITTAEKDYNSGIIDKDEYLNRWQSAQDDYESRLRDATGQDIPHVVVKDNVDPNTLEWHGQAPAQTQAAPPARAAAPPPPAAAAPGGPKNPYQQGTAQKPASQTVPEVPPKATIPAPKGAQGRVKGSDGNWYWFAGNKVLGRSN